MNESSPDQIPSFIGLEITRRCNLRCPHCFTASGGNSHPGPDTATMCKLLEDIAKAGGTKVAFSGGEPLLRKDLEEIMKHGRRFGIEGYGIVSNGYYATRNRARSLRDAGLTVMQISVDGVDATDHCAVRACDRRDYYRALRAIRLYRQENIAVDVACILVPRNLERAAEMAMFCEALGVRNLRYCAFVPTGRAQSNEIRDAYRPDPHKIDGVIAFWQEMNQIANPPIQIFIDHGLGPWHHTGSFSCTAGRDVAYISAEGDLYPCPGLIFDQFKVGNVFATPVGELLASPTMTAVHRIPKSQLNGPCATCPNDRCSGGCRGAALAATGDWLTAIRYCFVRRERDGLLGKNVNDDARSP
jgi:radical SAM protein with 4Fe4S-binding SPASM domain